MYVARQIGVKAKYGTTITDTEHAAMEAVLDTCPRQKAITGGGPTQAPADLTKTPQPEPEPPPEPKPEPEPEEKIDPIFDTCGEANDNGYSDYVEGQDPEYDYYYDRDGVGFPPPRRSPRSTASSSPLTTLQPTSTSPPRTATPPPWPSHPSGTTTSTKATAGEQPESVDPPHRREATLDSIQRTKG